MASKQTSAPWRVGVLFSQSGLTSVSEQAQLRGTLVAIDEINSRGGIDGRPVEPVVYDPGSDAATYAQYAKKLMIEDSVTTIFGGYTSSCRKAILPVVERLNGLLWYSAPYEGFEFSQNVICTGTTLNQNCIGLCRYLMRKFGKRFYFVGNDYIYPRVANQVMRDLVISSGGTVLGERYLNMKPSRSYFPELMKDIQKAQPDVIFSTMVGESTSFFYQAYHDAGFDPGLTPIASLTTSEPELKAMGYDVGEGHITAATYFESLNSDSNKDFLALYHHRYGRDEPVDMCLEAAFFQVNLWARALAATNTQDPRLLRSAVLGSDINAPQGNVAINPTYGHADLWSRIGRANHRGQFDVVYESDGCIASDPYMISYGRSLANINPD